MNYCAVSHDLARYERQVAEEEWKWEWVLDGGTEAARCEGCNLFFSKLKRLTTSACDACRRPHDYTQVGRKFILKPGRYYMAPDDAYSEVPPWEDDGEGWVD